MKRELFTVFLASFTLLLVAQEGRFVIQGKTSLKQEGDSVFLFTFRDDGYVNTVDTTTVTADGSFFFEGLPFMNTGALITIGSYPDKVVASDVILEAGTITVQIDSAVTVGGTHWNNLLQYFNDNYTGLDFLSKFIRNNLDNVVGRTVFIDNKNMPYPPFFELYALADENLKNNPQLKKEFEINKRFAQTIEEATSLAGTVYKDFTFLTLQGDKKSISDFVGKSKYLLIDVWASWCAPCIQDIPKWRELYAQYKDYGFEIVSVSLDNQESAWKSAVKKHQICRDQEHVGESEKSFRDSYSISSIPHYVLLDEKGTIVFGKASPPLVESMLKSRLSIQ